MIEFAKQLGAIFAVLTALYGVGDRTGWRPAWKWELDEQGWFNRRAALLDRIHDGRASPHEIGEFCGLSFVLKQTTSDVAC